MVWSKFVVKISGFRMLAFSRATLNKSASFAESSMMRIVSDARSTKEANAALNEKPEICPRKSTDAAGLSVTLPLFPVFTHRAQRGIDPKENLAS